MGYQSVDWQHFRIPTSNLIHLQQESTFTFPKGWKFSKARHVKVFGEICISAYIYLDICIHFVFYSCLLDLLQLPNHLLVLLTRAFTVIHSDFVIGWLNRGDMGILLMEFEPLYKAFLGCIKEYRIGCLLTNIYLHKRSHICSKFAK